MKLLLLLPAFFTMNADTDKKAVLQVLETKCNYCHRVANPYRVFNRKNMDINAADIYQQVFVKKRMPMGDGNPLSEQEQTMIKSWVSAVRNN